MAKRGSGTGKQVDGGEAPQKHVLHVYEVQTGMVLQQCPMALEHNEVSTLKPRFPGVLCKGRILTSDAAQSSHEFGRLVQWAGGDVIVFVKGNTPATQADLELFFEDDQADRRTWQSFEQIEKGHGRMPRRHILTSPDRNRLSATIGVRWDRSYARPRERKTKDKSSVEVVYGWTSLSPQHCSPKPLLQLLRAHWSVENRLHWLSSVTLGRMIAASVCYQWHRCWRCSTRWCSH